MFQKGPINKKQIYRYFNGPSDQFSAINNVIPYMSHFIVCASMNVIGRK